jgi:hypothetical protein
LYVNINCYSRHDADITAPVNSAGYSLQKLIQAHIALEHYAGDGVEKFTHQPALSAEFCWDAF